MAKEMKGSNFEPHQSLRMVNKISPQIRNGRLKTLSLNGSQFV